MRIRSTTVGRSFHLSFDLTTAAAAAAGACVLAVTACEHRAIRRPERRQAGSVVEVEKKGVEREMKATEESTEPVAEPEPAVAVVAEEKPEPNPPRDPSEPRMPRWPPKGRPTRLPVTRDAWVSAFKGERRGNTGGETRLKAKGWQETTLFDVNPSPLKGRIVTGALWHFHSASPKAPFLRLSISTVATPWSEGTSGGYRPQEGSVCFEQAELGQRLWAYPGSTLMDAAWGKGHTIWRFSESSPPDARGWASCAVEPDVVAARAAGLSHGFAVYDDVGSVWDVKNGEFRWQNFPNRFVHSREDERFAPYLEVWTDGEDRQPPRPVTGVVCDTAGFPAGEALVRWRTPRDRGRGKTLGFNVTCKAGDREKDMPRYLVPMAGRPGEEVRMHIRDLPFKPGERLTLTVRPVDSADNVGQAFTKTVTLSSASRAFKISAADVKPFNPSTRLPSAGGLRIAVVDLLDKIHPKTGEMIPPHSAGYEGGNHIWSAARRLVRLHAARNEAVCFQVNLEGSTDAAGVRLAFEDEPGLETNLFRFDCVNTEAGPMPDALVPLDGAFAIPARDDPEAAGQKNASVVCEIYVPHRTPPGRRRGRLTISNRGESLDIELDLTVWGFTLPDKLSFIPEMNCYGTAGPTGEGLGYYRLAHEHRCCLNRLYYNWRGTTSREPKLRPGGGFDWTEWDRDFSPLLDGSAFKDLPRKGEPVDVFYLPFNENWPVDVYSRYRKSYWVEEAFLPGYKEDLKKAFAEFARHFDRKGWHDTIFEFYLNNKVYNKKGKDWKRSSAPWIFDEPSNTQDFWALRWYGILFHQAVDPVRRKAKMWYRCDVSRTQFGRNMMWGVMDIEVMGGATPQKARMKRDERVLWWKSYFTEYGSANDPAAPNTQPVTWCLAAWADGGEGVLPWQTIGSKNCWRDGEKTCLFYRPKEPGAADRNGGPVPSVRLKAFRRGQQIVEYLTLLGEAYRQPRFALVGGAGEIIDLSAQIEKKSEADAGTIRFARSDPVGLWELRCRVGRMVDAKRPAYKRALRPMPTPETDMRRLPEIGYVSVGPIAPELPGPGDKPFRPERARARPESSTLAAAPAGLMSKRRGPAPAGRTSKSRGPAPADLTSESRGPVPVPEGDWKTIFNGRDLTGWRHAGEARVEDGALVSLNGGDVFHPADWSEFVLSCDVRAAGGMQLMGISLAHRRMGRGAGRVTLAFHGDGDVHVRGAGGSLLGKTGSGRFAIRDWTPVAFEITRGACRLYRAGKPVTTVDVSQAPVGKGGIYFYSHGGGRAAIRNVRVKILSR